MPLDTIPFVQIQQPTRQVFVQIILPLLLSTVAIVITFILWNKQIKIAEQQNKINELLYKKEYFNSKDKELQNELNKLVKSGKCNSMPQHILKDLGDYKEHLEKWKKDTEIELNTKVWIDKYKTE